MTEKAFLNRHRKEIIWSLIAFFIVVVLFNRIIFTAVAIIHERLMVIEEQRISNQRGRFEAAEQAFGREDYKAALARYRNFLIWYPDSGFSETARYKIAESLRFLKSDNKAAEAYYIFAGKYPESRLADAAILHIADIYRERLEKNTQRYNRRFRTADEAFGKKEFAKALRLYQQCLEHDPEGALTPAILYKIAESRRLLKYYLEALVTYHCFAQRYPDDRMTSAAMLHIAELYRFKQMPSEAINAYKAFIQKYPNDDNAESARYWIRELRE